MSLENNTTKLNEILEMANLLPTPEEGQEREVAPTNEQQIITPDEGYKFSKVTVSGIEYHEVENDAGGITVYIGCAPPLNDYSWSEISEISAAGNAANYFAVGDCKAVTLNGNVGSYLSLKNETLYVYIIGFDHNSAYEGTGIHFGMFKTAVSDGIDVALIDDSYSYWYAETDICLSMNHWAETRRGGWKGCDLRYDILGSTNQAPSGYGAANTTSRTGYDATSTTATNPISGTLMAALPSDLRAVMKPMTKYTDNVGDGNDIASYVTPSVDYLPLLAQFEIVGDLSMVNSAEQNYQQQYTYYADGNSKGKYGHNDINTEVAYWTRSPYCQGSIDNFVYCESFGLGGAGTDIGSMGLAPIFKI